MPDYKEMYLIMARMSERVERLLEEAASLVIEAQQQCEELYISAPDPELIVLPPGGGEEDT